LNKKKRNFLTKVTFPPVVSLLESGPISIHSKYLWAVYKLVDRKQSSVYNIVVYHTTIAGGKDQVNLLGKLA